MPPGPRACKLRFVIEAECVRQKGDVLLGGEPGGDSPDKVREEVIDGAQRETAGAGRGFGGRVRFEVFGPQA